MSENGHNPLELFGWEAYNVYLGIRIHFTTKKFNYLKNRPKTSVTAFKNRNDHKFFALYQKEKNKEEIFLANIIENIDFWIGDIETAQKVHKDWQRRVQSLNYIFKEELKKIPTDLPKLIKVRRGELPGLVSLYIQRVISLETLVIIADCSNCISYWNKALKDHLLWGTLGLRITKYKIFLELRYDREKYIDLIKKHLRKEDTKQAI